MPSPTAADRQGLTAERQGLTADRQAAVETGHPAVDAAVQAMDNATDLPPDDQIAQYEATHRILRETLATIDDG